MTALSRTRRVVWPALIVALAAGSTPLVASAQTAGQTQAQTGCATVEVNNVRPQQGFVMLAAYADAASYSKKPVAALRLAAGDAALCCLRPGGRQRGAATVSRPGRRRQDGRQPGGHAHRALGHVRVTRHDGPELGHRQRGAGRQNHRRAVVAVSGGSTMHRRHLLQALRSMAGAPRCWRSA